MSFTALMLAAVIVAHEQGYVTALSNHLQRWLKSENISARVVTPSQMGTALKNERVAFLVGFDEVTQGEMNTLRSFAARGGKLTVFHSSSTKLGELMGVKPVGYRAAAYAGEMSKMVFARGKGFPSEIRQTSTALQRARPIAGRSQVVATWVDRAGKLTGEPAWIKGSKGYWMTHVLLADGDEDLKAQLVAAIVGEAEPKTWSLETHNSRVMAKAREMSAYAARQTGKMGEIHAVWDHSGCGLYAGNWPRTFATLKAAHVTDLWVNVAGAGFAHYASAVLPRSKTFAQEGDQLAACLKAASGTGIRVHAWILCFSATRSSPEILERFRQRGWRLKATNGKLTEYLDPANAAVRAHILAAIDELQAKRGISGIHLDFVRYGDSAAKPKNASLTISKFVAEARRRVKRPKWLTAAVYGKYPNCVATVGQDWVGWAEGGLVDYVVPMDYTDSLVKFEELVDQHAASKALSKKVIAGIGVTANESRLDARKVIDQINITRRYGLAGESLFDLDITLQKTILPYLAAGIWKF